jgi:hypothetical protein
MSGQLTGQLVEVAKHKLLETAQVQPNIYKELSDRGFIESYEVEIGRLATEDIDTTSLNKLNKAQENMESYLVRDHLNTINLIGNFYYDFHEWGVLILMLLWSTVFGIMQAFCEKHTGPISLLVLGNAMTPVALNFFSAWTSVFSFWLMWGTTLLMAIALYIKISPKKIEEEH